MPQFRKPVVGETLVYYKPGRHGSADKISEVKVTKVGTKYFRVKSFSVPETEFERKDWEIKDSWNSRYNFPAFVFETMADLGTMLETGKLREAVLKRTREFGWERSLDLEQLRALAGILKIANYDKPSN